MKKHQLTRSSFTETIEKVSEDNRAINSSAGLVDLAGKDLERHCNFLSSPGAD